LVLEIPLFGAAYTQSITEAAAGNRQTCPDIVELTVLVNAPSRLNGRLRASSISEL